MAVWGRRGHEQDGASAVEFALVLIPLVLMLFGIISFGLAFTRAQGMEAAAREGARLASLGRTVTFAQVETAVRNAAPPVFIQDPGHIDVLVNGAKSNGWCSAAGDTVTVEAAIHPDHQDNYVLFIPLWPGSGTQLRFESTGVFRCEAPHQ